MTELDRTLELIRPSAEFEAPPAIEAGPSLYESQKAYEAQERAYAEDARELDAEILKEGQEIEGEILDVVNVDGKNYYVVECDGERYAVPAGQDPQFEAGDDIQAERGRDRVEVQEARSYGR